MIELGLELKAARENMGLSLRDVEDKTKIRVKYLTAIDEGDFAVIPEVIFLKGFIKSYANCVGLDGEAMVRRYIELDKIEQVIKMEELKVEKSKKKEQIGQDDSEGPKSKVKPGWIVFTVVILAVFTIVAYYISR